MGEAKRLRTVQWKRDQLKASAESIATEAVKELWENYQKKKKEKSDESRPSDSSE